MRGMCRVFSDQGIDTRRELLAFHEKHYHARNMALVILGKEDLDVLEEWARTCFAEVNPESIRYFTVVSIDRLAHGLVLPCDFLESERAGR